MMRSQSMIEVPVAAGFGDYRLRLQALAIMVS